MKTVLRFLDLLLSVLVAATRERQPMDRRAQEDGTLVVPARPLWHYIVYVREGLPKKQGAAG